MIQKTVVPVHGNHIISYQALTAHSSLRSAYSSSSSPAGFGGVGSTRTSAFSSMPAPPLRPQPAPPTLPGWARAAGASTPWQCRAAHCPRRYSRTCAPKRLPPHPARSEPILLWACLWLYACWCSTLFRFLRDWFAHHRDEEESSTQTHLARLCYSRPSSWWNR
jgi:hypothetical protein